MLLANVPAARRRGRQKYRELAVVVAGFLAHHLKVTMYSPGFKSDLESGAISGHALRWAHRRQTGYTILGVFAVKKEIRDESTADLV
jgi:hypothetical protein